jgi:uracil-DNA glycosylase
MLKLRIVKPVQENWTLEQVAAESAPSSWQAVFRDAAPELKDVSTILAQQEQQFGAYYPLKKDIFNAFKLTPLDQVKVVIVGQDPYHQGISIDGVSMPRAMGLSFSVRKGDSIPSSLNNIYKELLTVRGFSKPDHGDLSEWARQGVLMLNTCLTVQPNKAGSHGDIWLGFMNKVFRAISHVNPYCIFVLWGKEAQKIKTMLGERCVVFEAAHPSGLSASRGFFGCNHFNMINEALQKQGKTPISWRITPIVEVTPVQTNYPSNAMPTIPTGPIGPVLGGPLTYVPNIPSYKAPPAKCDLPPAQKPVTPPMVVTQGAQATTTITLKIVRPAPAEPTVTVDNIVPAIPMVVFGK